MRTRMMTVTPKLALEWLEKNHCNRPISTRSVEKYKVLIQRGRFYSTHQGIAFDEQDRLRDGQHRLRAIVETGTSLSLLVTSGLSEESVQAIDDGRKRTDQQVLSMTLGQFVHPFSTAIAREMYGGALHFGTGRQRVRPMRTELIDFYRETEAAIRFTTDAFKDHGTGLAVGFVAAPIARAFYHLPHRKLTRFAEVLSSGYSRKGEEIIIRLRNYIIRERRGKQREVRDEVYGRIERALQLYFSGEEAANLTAVKAELYSLPGDAALIEAHFRSSETIAPI